MAAPTVAGAARLRNGRRSRGTRARGPGRQGRMAVAAGPEGSDAVLGDTAAILEARMEPNEHAVAVVGGGHVGFPNAVDPPDFGGRPGLGGAGPPGSTASALSFAS